MALLGFLWVGPVIGAEGGPDLAFSGLSTEDGLSQSSVFALAEDRLGFLWLGTEDGLNRWDGQGFRVFSVGPRSDPEALHGHFVHAIVEDSAGRLWLGTEGGGLARFDPETETFRSFHHDEGDPRSLPEDLVLSLALDGSGDLWAGTRSRGLVRLRDAVSVGPQAVFERFPQDPDESCAIASGNVNGLAVDGTGRLWVATGDGLYRRQVGETCFERIADSGANRLSETRLTHVLVSRDGELWVASRGGLDRLDPERGEVVARYLPGEVVETVLEDREGLVWVGTEAGGLVRLDPATGQATRFRSRPFDSESLATDVVRSLFEDRSGTLWVGLEQGGVARLPRLRRRFGRWREARTEAGDEQLKSVFALWPGDDGEVWVGTRDRGLFALDRGTGTARHWVAGDGRPDALDSSRISALAGGGDGSLLVGTVSGGVYRVEPATGRFQQLSVDGQRSIRALLDDGARGLWVAAWGKGLRHLRHDGSVVVYAHDADDPASLGDNVVLCLAPERGVEGGFDALWAGTWSAGVTRLDLVTGKARVYRHDPADQASLSSDQVAAIHRDAAGRVWVGSAGGLDVLQPGAADFERIETFAGSVVFGLLEDERGHLWASSNHGLWHYDPESGRSARFHARDGLQAEEFNVGAAVVGSGGEIFFGGVLGFNAFRPGDFETDGGVISPLPSPPVTFTRFATDRRELSPSRLHRLAETGEVLELEPDERAWTVTFAALGSSDPERDRFAVRFDPASGSAPWLDAGTQREARFNRVAPGRHVFEVAVLSDHGVESQGAARLLLDARPTFLERRAVHAAGGVLVVALLAWGVEAASRRRLRRLERQREEAIEVRRRLLAARDAERLRLAQDLHDGPLQHLHALQLAASREDRVPGGWRDGLGSLVAELRAVCTRLRSPVLQLLGLEAAIREQVEEVRREHPEVEIALDLRLGGPGTGDDLGPDVRLTLFRVLREALLNALRHAAPHRVEVDLERLPGSKPARVRLAVRDDGRGFSLPERWLDLARRGHLGLLGMDERVDALGGRLEVRSRPGQGTSVEAVLPVLGGSGEQLSTEERRNDAG
ncbi:MAG: hypothetical protein KDD11_19580 [Acidobacteria bacterium]|nr:hypothetical protein [Acidobacteriota bacterium]